MSIGEVKDAKSKTTTGARHRLMVEKYKTGSIQLATIFLDRYVFQGLFLFVRSVLTYLACYRDCKLKSGDLAFETYSGCPITSSRVTPLVQRGPLDVGIVFKGTTTDFRRAAATLISQYSPNTSDKMPLLIGHSRTCQDRHYRIQIGHLSLVDAYDELEKVQTTPRLQSRRVNKLNASLYS